MGFLPQPADSEGRQLRSGAARARGRRLRLPARMLGNARFACAGSGPGRPTVLRTTVTGTAVHLDRDVRQTRAGKQLLVDGRLFGLV